MTDWSVPFAERYHMVKRTLKAVPQEIEYRRGLIAYEQQRIAARMQTLADAEAEWAAMQVDEAEQIAALEAHHDAVKGHLRKARSPR